MDKPVYINNFYYRLESDWTIERLWVSSESFNFILKKQNDIKKELLLKVDSNIQSGVLYFSKKSTFPRFRLTDSAFKRCIKEDKADRIVVPDNLIFCERRSGILLEDSCAYYYINSNAAYYLKQDYAGWLTLFQKKHWFFGEDVKIIFEGEFTAGTDEKITELNNLLNTKKKLLLDKNLNSLISGKLDILDKENIENICALLDSPDASIRGVGLKTLINFDVEKTPLTVRTMLGLRYNLSYLPEWNSVAIKQLRQTINYTGEGTFPNGLYYILQSENISKEDFELCRELYTREAEKLLKSKIDDFNETMIAKTFKLNADYVLSKGDWS